MRHIIETADDTLSRFGGRTVFETAENSGARVWFRGLGTLKGFYICENGCRYIVINETLDGVLQAVVCAHELGHDMLHRELSGGGIRETTLFLGNNRTEREANLFAAEILISDEDFFDAATGENSADNIAAMLNVPVELLQYKLEILNFKGHKFNVCAPKNDFLKG